MKTTRPVVITLVVAVLALCYAPTLRGMYDQWSSDEDMGHAFVVPLVVLWILWRERPRWTTLPIQPSPWGFAILLAAAALQLIGSIGAGLFVSSVAFLISIAGLVVCLGGFRLLRAWAFPFLVALFMLPKLAVVYNQVTLPLQLFASKLAAGMLTTTGVAVAREGNLLNVAGHQISVAEACSGIRYLLSLGFVAVVFAYLADTKPWMRVALLAAAVPVAILANAIRVAAIGLLPVLDTGAPHAVSGWSVFVLCLGLLFVAHRFFNAIHLRYHA